MFLKRMELQGFKSFADKAVISFDSDVIGIVGPNGCGKSNINDAIRWVLGEQSVKSLRGTSMSDVIFSGSSQRKPVNIAEVTLIFDNSKHALNVEFEEVEVTRRLHRHSGEGEYFINKSPCRLKDVLDLVMDSGLGRDSLSIITQGNISTFADAKPEDRRALFEEAAGVAKYKKRKNESLNKLNRTAENLARVEDIIIELERQVNPLKRQAKKAKMYLDKKERLEMIEITVLVNEIEGYNNALSELKKKAFEIETQKASFSTTVSVEDIQNKELREEMFALDKEVHALQEKFAKMNEQVRALEKQKIEMDEKRKYTLEMANNKERAKELKVMLEEAQFEYEDRRKRKEDSDINLALYKDNMEKLDNDISFSNNEFSQANSILNQLRNRKDLIENLVQKPFDHQRAIKTLLDAKQTLSGILGVVSQLFKPSDNYEMAISSSLAGAMYHVVTSDEQSARHAITFLKKNQAGRATFLPLTVMKPHNIQKEQLLTAQHSVGFLGIAADFVSNDEVFDSLRDSLLGNVIICDNLINANEIARTIKYQYKIVTLEGDIVNKGGSMTGGRNANQSLPLTMQKELTQISGSLEGQEMKVEQLRQQTNGLLAKKERVQSELMQLEIACAQLETIVSTKYAAFNSLKSDYEQIAPEDKNGDTPALHDETIVKLSAFHSQMDEISFAMKSKRERRMKMGSEMERKEQQIRQVRRDLNEIQNEERLIEVSIAKNETNLDNAIDRLSTTYEMTFEYANQQKKDIDMDIDEAKSQVIILRQEIHALGNVNLDAPGEYQEVSKRFEFLTSQKDDLIAAKDKILKAINEMDEIMITQFKEMFDKINAQLSDVFRALFGGGKARLILLDPEDILNTGIDIDVQPPGKNVQNIRLFSGGEKSLIAICVLFSILKARTMPLCIFDEVEAALDQANVERFAKYIAQFRGESQFIVVTHRPGTMAQCDSLYGITMQQDGVSQLLKVQLQDAVNLIEPDAKVEVNA